MTGRAIDILDDKDQFLGTLIASKPELLKKHGLWLEALTSTKGVITNWVHLDNSVSRKGREIQIFLP